MIKRRIRHLHSLFFSLFVATLPLASHAADGNSDAAIIFDNTAGQNNAALITNMSTWRTPKCSRQDVLKDNSQNCIAMKGNNDIQVIQNDGTGNLLNMIGVNNSGSTSYENKNTPRQSYYFAEGQHLFDINEFRTAAANMTALSPSLDKNTYGVISFEQFIVNVANGKTMNGIVRVKVPLIVKTSSPGKAKSHDDDDESNDDGESGNDDGNDDGEDGNHSGKSDKHNKSDDDGESGNDDGNDDGESSDDDDENDGHVKMCGEKPTAECGLCGPGSNTVIEAGKTVCGHKLPANAQINVNGALLFDWVNCKTDEVIEVNEFPSNPSKIGFGISVPLNINPANINASTQTMASIHDIKAILGNGVCADGSPCNVQLNPTITWSMIPSESKEMFQYKINETLTEARFATLSNTDKFHLLFPSGYANGWSTALNNLGITPATWNQWGFNNGASGNSFSSGDIRNESFQDIPALMYTGGLISINHHTNISGLIYAPQAIEISQLGVGGQDNSNDSQTCSPGKGSNDDGDDDGSDDSSGDNDDSSSNDDGQEGDDDNHGNACGGKEDDDGDEDGNDDGKDDDGHGNKSNDDGDGDGNDDSTNDDGHSGQSDDDSDEDGNDDGSNDDGDNGQNNNPNPPVNTPFVSSQQYISGSIIVRNGFYFEAKKADGVTLISNNPDTYSNIELDSGSEIPGNFQPHQSPYQAPSGNGSGGNGGGPDGDGSNPPDDNSGGGNPPGDPPNAPNTPPGGGDNSILTGGLGGAQASTTGGTQWVEIRPQ